jgi:thiol-disulfide isomerase/thioredoxin
MSIYRYFAVFTALTVAGGLLLFSLTRAAAKPEPVAPAQPAAPLVEAPEAAPAPEAPAPPAIVAAKPGDAAPDFTLTDSDGKSWSLAELTAGGKIVILEWFSPGCPACKAYYEPGADGAPARMEQIIASVAGEDVLWFAVNSGDPAKDGNPEHTAAIKAEWGVSAPILLDPTGEIGKSYGAQRTPHIAIVAPTGTYAYRGAPEERSTAEGVEGLQFVTRTVTELRAGAKLPTILETQAFG